MSSEYEVFFHCASLIYCYDFGHHHHHALPTYILHQNCIQLSVTSNKVHEMYLWGVMTIIMWTMYLVSYQLFYQATYIQIHEAGVYWAQIMYLYDL